MDSNSTLTSTTNQVNPSISSHSRQNSRQRIPILEYFPRWVAVNKPNGMTMHQGGGPKQKGPQLRSTLKRQLSRKIWLAHRLDHRTSGALIVAFDSDASAMIHSALKKADKKYIALLRGDWDERYANNTTMTIDAPLKMSDGTMKDCVTQFTRLAVFERMPDDSDSLKSIYVNNNRWLNTACTLVVANPRTGRTHQIRMHSARHLGMPILGDSQHGDSVVNRFWRSRLDRLALHCLSVENLQLPPSLLQADDDNTTTTSTFTSSGTSREAEKERSMEEHGTVVNIIAPLPDDFRVFLNTTLPLLEPGRGGNTPNFWSRALQEEPHLNSTWKDIRSGTLGKKPSWQRGASED